MSSLANLPESVTPPLRLKEALLEWLRDMQASDGRPSLRDRLEIAELIESGRFDAPPPGGAITATLAFEAGAADMAERIAQALIDQDYINARKTAAAIRDGSLLEAGE